jgi:hypothetical protein
MKSNVVVVDGWHRLTVDVDDDAVFVTNVSPLARFCS